jgi:ABC-type phosphate transport system ATPase subunit
LGALDSERDGLDPAEQVRAVWQLSPAVGETFLRSIGHPLQSLAPPQLRLAMVTAAVALGQRILLLDEPEADLDAESRDALANLLRSLSGQRSVVVVTHHLDFARAIADQVLLLVDGKVIEQGPATRIFHAPRRQRTRSYLRTGS